MPQWPVGLDMKLSRPNKWGFISVGVYFRGGYFPWGFISYIKSSGVFFRGGLFPRPTFTRILICRTDSN